MSGITDCQEADINNCFDLRFCTACGSRSCGVGGVFLAGFSNLYDIDFTTPFCVVFSILWKACDLVNVLHAFRVFQGILSGHFVCVGQVGTGLFSLNFLLLAEIKQCYAMDDSHESFDAIRGYFTAESWKELSLYEKQMYCNIKANYDKRMELGKLRILFFFCPGRLPSEKKGSCFYFLERFMTLMVVITQTSHVLPYVILRKLQEQYLGIIS